MEKIVRVKMVLYHIIFYISLLSIILSNDECQIDGVKGFTFGMTEDKAVKNTQIPMSTIDEIISQFSDINSESDILKFEKEYDMCLRCIHETSFMGNKAKGTLGFSKKGLYQITYSISIDTKNKGKYIETYFDIKSALTKKYGEPGEIEYLDYPYKDDFPRGDHAGQAISIGKGKYWSSFKCDQEKKDEPYINLMLSGDNYEVSLTLNYVNQNYNISKEEQEKKILDEF